MPDGSAIAVAGRAAVGPARWSCRRGISGFWRQPTQCLVDHGGDLACSPALVLPASVAFFHFSMWWGIVSALSYANGPPPRQAGQYLLIAMASYFVCSVGPMLMVRSAGYRLRWDTNSPRVCRTRETTSRFHIVGCSSRCQFVSFGALCQTARRVLRFHRGHRQVRPPD